MDEEAPDDNSDEDSKDDDENEIIEEEVDPEWELEAFYETMEYGTNPKNMERIEKKLLDKKVW